MKCREIIDILETLAPAMMACDWDNPGLLAGRRDKEVKKILIALDATDQVVQEAVENGIDLLITHHPLIFRPVKQINDSSLVGRRLLALIRDDISYYAMHTNFDSAPGCMGDLAVRYLGIEKEGVLEPLGMDESGNEYGIGAYGTLSEEVTLPELAGLVKRAFHLDFLTAFGGEADFPRIRRVAVCPGSGGGSTLKLALKRGVQAYITGDISHHDGIDAAADGMAVIDAGHYGIEHIFMEFMVNYLKERLGGEVLAIRAHTSFPNRVY